MSQYFPKPYEPFGWDINVKVDLSNYVTKDDIKNITHVDTSNFAIKTNLTNLKTEVDKLDIDKLKSLPNNLNNLKTKVETSFSFGNETGRNVIIFGVDMSLSSKIDNRKRTFSFLVKDLHKDQNIRLVQKNCIRLTLLRKIQNFV